MSPALFRVFECNPPTNFFEITYPCRVHSLIDASLKNKLIRKWQVF